MSVIVEPFTPLKNSVDGHLAQVTELNYVSWTLKIICQKHADLEDHLAASIMPGMDLRGELLALTNSAGMQPGNTLWIEHSLESRWRLIS